MAETIISKKCSHCKEIKPISEFYKKPFGKYGLQSNCKICHISSCQTDKAKLAKKIYRNSDKGKIVRKRYQQSKEYKISRERHKQTEKFKITQENYSQSDAYKTVMKRYNVNNPEKRRARTAVNHAVKNGKLPRPDTLPCYYCPKPAKQYHHNQGYSPEHRLDVIPVCKKCHSEHPHYADCNNPAGSK